MATVTKILKCVDCNAPSSKYPAMGFQVEFSNKNYEFHYAEYQSIRDVKDEILHLKEGIWYEITFCEKISTGFLGKIYHRMTRLKNIKQIQN